MTPLQVRGSLLSREPDRAQHQGAEFYVGSPAATPGVLSDRGACRKSRRRTPVIKALLPQVRDLHRWEHGYNAETRWEELTEAGYLTPSIRFFSQSRALHLPCRRRVLTTVHLCLA